MVVITISNYMGRATCTLHYTSITTRAQGPGHQLSESTVLSRKNICCGSVTKNIFNLSKIFTASEPAAAQQQPGPRGRLSESKSEKPEHLSSTEHNNTLAHLHLHLHFILHNLSEEGGKCCEGAGSRSQHWGAQQLCCWYWFNCPSSPPAAPPPRATAALPTPHRSADRGQARRHAAMCTTAHRQGARYNSHKYFLHSNIFLDHWKLLCI